MDEWKEQATLDDQIATLKAMYIKARTKRPDSWYCRCIEGAWLSLCQLKAIQDARHEREVLKEVGT